MPLPYRSARVELPGLKGLDETTDATKHIAILRETVEQLAHFINIEFARASTSMNGPGGVAGNFRTITADTVAASTDDTLAYDTTSGNVQAQLPLASAYPGMEITVYRSAGANTATLAPSGSDTIVGGGAATITTGGTYKADAVNNNWVLLP